ncbi:hypothetical protein KAFR_0A02440 [Kazachstania africana CBS 2517]|uniref:PQ-loop repeat-containing protein n=1 Tax=Kazachstania africana (strain ATCC 22294 / BCRC 22015 / CBS 2517 / CECT 1963 / NBRC 1671 / NRRL Y-8276) TaxID=1071382 RepID=H2AMT2_KAZAF|nr:hypothetical protein KAFR_0A02440 [Kazachstania africana CBS 2517]CCF55682.1 hypothetical protein KAFR_0A02440 [Kazachstania africana CBS 2517]
MISKGAATAFATLGTVCWCIQLIPQIISNYRRKDCTGFPPLMMFLWVVSGIPFAIYFCVSRGNIILQIQPHLFMFFCAVSFIQSCYYPPTQLDKRIIIAIIAGLILLDVGMEVGFILWLRLLYDRGIEWPDLIFGIIASVLLSIGLIPPYFELAKRRGRVVGINFLFLFIDSLGAWLSIISVVLGNMDVMGIILYALVAGLEIGIFASHFIWCCRFKWFGKKLIDSESEEKETDDTNDANMLDLEKIQSNDKPHSYTAVPDDNTIKFVFEDSDDISISSDTCVIQQNNSSNVHAVHGIVLAKTI